MSHRSSYSLGLGNQSAHQDEILRLAGVEDESWERGPAAEERGPDTVEGGATPACHTRQNGFLNSSSCAALSRSPPCSCSLPPTHSTSVPGQSQSTKPPAIQFFDALLPKPSSHGRHRRDLDGFLVQLLSIHNTTLFHRGPLSGQTFPTHWAWARPSGPGGELPLDRRKAFEVDDSVPTPQTGISIPLGATPRFLRVVPEQPELLYTAPETLFDEICKAEAERMSQPEGIRNRIVYDSVGDPFKTEPAPWLLVQ